MIGTTKTVSSAGLPCRHRGSFLARPKREVARWGRACAVAALVAMLGGGTSWSAEPRPAVAGFVDGQRFIDLAGDDTVSVEISLHGALLHALTRFDPELATLVGGLESIHAVILDLSGEDGQPRADMARLGDTVSSTERELLRRGWERIARVRDGDADVKVLVLNDAEVIRGLVVLILDKAEQQLVFTNVAGVIDLAALERLGGQMEIPGLERLQEDEQDREDGDEK